MDDMDACPSCDVDLAVEPVGVRSTELCALRHCPCDCHYEFQFDFVEQRYVPQRKPHTAAERSFLRHKILEATKPK
jgi:hypothetical protein